MKRVLVTGAAGFVGAHLGHALAENRIEVDGLGLGTSPGAPYRSWHAVDLRAADELKDVIASIQPDGIVHLAGQSSAAHSFADPAGTFEANVNGTWNLLEAVRTVAPKARTLVIGSGECYGPQPEGSRVPETTPFAPVSPYALSKAAADALAALHASAFGLDVIRVRPFGHTGPGQTTRFIVPAIAAQIAAIENRNAEPVVRVGNLAVTRDLCDVRDVVRAYLVMLTNGRAGTVYNVCRGEGIRLDALVHDLITRARVTIQIEPDPARMRKADVPWLVGDGNAIAEDLGWRPRIPLADTLDDVLVEWRATTGFDRPMETR